MKKSHKSLAISLILFCIIAACPFCKKDQVDNIIEKEELTGHVQKGPFINGTSVQMYELNKSLSQTGKNFSTQINNNKGSFEIEDISLSSKYVEFLANGYYFNEIAGNISTSPLTLYALSDINDLSTVNVNILTHLERSRVRYLVDNKEDFSDAKNTAQVEILGIFGISFENMDSSESLDITVNEESNGILLAISLILQGDRNVGDFTELLADIITEIEEDGLLNNEGLLEKLRSSAMGLDLVAIRNNLETRYQELGENVTIPDFEKYINVFLSSTGKKPTVSILPSTNITTYGSTLNGIANANSLPTVISFEYGETTDYGTSINYSQNPISGFTNINVSADVSGLLPGKIYHYRMKAENDLGLVYSDDMIFNTLGQAPLILNQFSLNETPTTATLVALVNANYLTTIVAFEYGITSSYGQNINASESPINGNDNIQVSTNLINLLPQNTYHFRVKVENELGVRYGEDMIFETDPISLGQTLGGGIVFYIDDTGEHGFICAPINQAQGVPWDNGTQIIINTSTLIGTGKPNTAAIVSAQGPGNYAAYICDQLELNGYNDWFLPSLDELELMDAQKHFINGLTGSGYYEWYWSSSQSGGSAYLWSFAQGGQAYSSTFNTGSSVRAIRSF